MRSLVAVLIVLSGVVVLAAQASSAVEFEVSSVRPAAPDRPVSEIIAAMRPASGQWRSFGLTLLNVIVNAYPEFRLPGLIVGAPVWAKETRFDLQGRMSPTSTHGQVETMVRHLLEDRFGLRTHIERRTLDVYLLTLKAPGKLGSGLTPAPTPCVVQRLTGGRIPAECNLYRTRGGEGAFTASAVTIAEFITAMTGMAAISGPSTVGRSTGIDRPVVDRTGLDGYFQIIGPSPMTAGEPTGSFFSLLEEQLGLKLTRAKEMVDVLVIDSVSMPEPD